MVVGWGMGRDGLMDVRRKDSLVVSCCCCGSSGCWFDCDCGIVV